MRERRISSLIALGVVAGCGSGVREIAPDAPIAAATVHLGALTDAGIDTRQLPFLGDLQDLQEREVMKTFRASLGVGCGGCHLAADGGVTGRGEEGAAFDLPAPTPNKNVARHMWNDWVRNFTLADGGALYCDSCHQGRERFLDRSQPKVLAQWMSTNFVSGLRRKDGGALNCSTCHGTPFNGAFLAAWRDGGP